MNRRLVSAMYNEFYPFNELDLFSDFAVARDPDDLREGDVLVSWGGEDISPALYNRQKARQTHAQEVPSRRDSIEWALMKRAKRMGIPIIGVCRGAQMLCALEGGFLVQHVNNHGGYHEVITNDNKAFQTNSIHHQMQYPFEVDHELVAWMPRALSDVYIDENREIDVPVEPEFVYYPGCRGFGVQWHPEMMSVKTEANQFVLSYIKERL